MCFNRRIWKLQRLERDGRNGNANAACHRATGRLVAPDSWYRSDQPSRDPFFSFCRPVFAPFSRHVARNNIIERRAKTPGADSVLEKNLFYRQTRYDSSQMIRWKMYFITKITGIRFISRSLDSLLCADHARLIFRLGFRVDRSVWRRLVDHFLSWSRRACERGAMKSRRTPGGTRRELSLDPPFIATTLLTADWNS